MPVIDAHAHWFPQPWIDLLLREGEANGATMGKNEKGQTAFTKVTLRPQVTLAGGGAIAPDELERLHHEAHASCFIANSVTAHLVVEPR